MKVFGSLGKSASGPRSPLAGDPNPASANPHRRLCGSCHLLPEGVWSETDRGVSPWHPRHLRPVEERPTRIQPRQEDAIHD